MQYFSGVWLPRVSITQEDTAYDTHKYAQIRAHIHTDRILKQRRWRTPGHTYNHWEACKLFLYANLSDLCLLVASCLCLRYTIQCGTRTHSNIVFHMAELYMTLYEAEDKKSGGKLAPDIPFACDLECLSTVHENIGGWVRVWWLWFFVYLDVWFRWMVRRHTLIFLGLSWTSVQSYLFGYLFYHGASVLTNENYHFYCYYKLATYISITHTLQNHI